VSDSDYQEWERQAQVLAGIGRSLFTQPLRLRVRLPRGLADHAVDAWQQEARTNPLPKDEPANMRLVRRRAGTLGLIGLSIEQSGVPDGDDVVFDLDAWYIGSALDAAEDAGLLADVRPPSS
jgi:hypothetical protein